MVTDAARKEITSEGSGEIEYELAILESDSFEEPLRIVSSREEYFTLQSQGETFYAYPFAAVWPPQDASQPFVGGQFEINNVVAQDGSDEPVVLAALRGLPHRARIRFMIVRASTPDVIEAKTTRLRLTGISYDNGTITGTLEMPDLTGRRAGKRCTPDQYPNLRPG